MADQTAALAAPDQPQTSPLLQSTDDAEIVRRVRDEYPDWQTTMPSISAVRKIAGGGQTRAIRLHRLVQTAGLDDQTKTPEPTDRLQLSSPKVALPLQDANKVAFWRRLWRRLMRKQHRKSSVPDQKSQMIPPVVKQTVRRSVPSWPLIGLALPAFVAIWSGWVGLGEMTGFGMVDLLPGFTRSDGSPLLGLDTAITLPIGMEMYAAYALWVWLSRTGSDQTRRFAKWSAIGSLILGAAGQIAYHLLNAEGVVVAPWPVTMVVACLPVAVVGMGAGLAHLVRADREV